MNSNFAVSAPRIFDGEDWHENSALVVENGWVREISPIDDLPESVDVEHLSDGFLAPGFVDVQVNGGGGVLLNDCPDVDGIRAICEAHAKFGVTSLLPTLVTDIFEIRQKALDAGVAAAKAGVLGFAGLHIEGPHLSTGRKGAHDPNLIRTMEPRDVEALINARAELPILMTTVAAESVTAAQVRMMSDAGVAVSIGHSDASYEDVAALVDAGASMVTHLFNAMSQMQGRAPGVVGAALNMGALHAGIICDGHHVQIEAMQIALRAKAGPGRIFLISDAMSATGTDVTEITLNGRKITRAGGKLTLEDGTLAGADLDLALAVKIAHQQVGLDLGEALRMASLYPAEAVGLSGVGRLTAGSKASFVWLNDAIKPCQVWVAPSH